MKLAAEPEQADTRGAKLRAGILYEGPSLADGAPIVVIATRGSNNPMTGPMLQTWILRADVDPVTASRLGEEASICGACPHRGEPTTRGKGLAAGRSCYVNLGQAPLGIYRAYRRGSYGRADTPEARREIGAGHAVRLGAYGDPAFVPATIWRELLTDARGHTGYSHQPEADTSYLMRSADDEPSARDAWSRGERTFRVLREHESPVDGREILCPASIAGGRKTVCARCTLCRGSTIDAPSIAIYALGSGRVHFERRAPANDDADDQFELVAA